ncbi:MAG: T9SS type A sorting domain-containing protein [Bacteroidetes bacterium]|nr:T9SS type A sorting domain-containing protein [Bacteroidota bacterium]
MKKIIISAVIIALVCFGSNIIAQQAVVTGGNFHQNSQGSITWGLGEAVIETFKQDNIIVTQGFQQSKLTVTSIYDVPESEFSIVAFPNPANDFVYLKIESSEFEGVQFVVYDINGRMLIRQHFSSELEKISFSDLRSGVYFIKVIHKEKELKNFKIIKK